MGEGFKFSLFQLGTVPPGGDHRTTLRSELEQILLAEELGYDGIWLAEHHFHQWGFCPSPSVFGAHVAARTRRLRIGIAISVLPLHHPLRVAEDYALLDVLSEGRLNFGVGRGNVAREFKHMGIPAEETRDRLRENLDVILKAWTRDSFSYEGQFYRFEDVTVWPKTIQKPHPPLYVGAGSPETAVWAAEIGAGCMWTVFTSYSDLANLRGQFEEAAARFGRPADEIRRIVDDTPIQRMVWLAEDETQAKEELWRGIQNSYAVRKQTVLPGEIIPFKHHTLEEQIERGAALVGTPEQVAEKVMEFRERTGYPHILCWMGVGGLPHDLVTRSMRLFAERVMPRVR